MPALPTTVGVKYGGAAMADVSAIMNVGDLLLAETGDVRQIVVPSALQGVTNQLIEARDLEATIEQQYVQIANTLRFFELEWIAMDDDRAEELASAPAVAGDSHHLPRPRKYHPPQPL